MVRVRATARVSRDQGSEEDPSSQQLKAESAAAYQREEVDQNLQDDASVTRNASLLNAARIIYASRSPRRQPSGKTRSDTYTVPESSPAGKLKRPSHRLIKGRNKQEASQGPRKSVYDLSEPSEKSQRHVRYRGEEVHDDAEGNRGQAHPSPPKRGAENDEMETGGPAKRTRSHPQVVILVRERPAPQGRSKPEAEVPEKTKKGKAPKTTSKKTKRREEKNEQQPANVRARASESGDTDWEFHEDQEVNGGGEDPPTTGGHEQSDSPYEEEEEEVEQPLPKITENGKPLSKGRKERNLPRSAVKESSKDIGQILNDEDEDEDDAEDEAEEGEPSPIYLDAEDGDEDEQGHIDLLGEGREMDKIFRFARRGPLEPKSGTPTVSSIRNGCRAARELFGSLQEEGVEVDKTQLEDTIQNIRNMVIVLRSAEKKKERGKLAHAMYTRGYHSLAVLFITVWRHYAFTSAQDSEDDSQEFTPDALRILISFISIVVDLESTIVQNWKLRQLQFPDKQEGGFVRPAREQFIVPLRKIQKLLKSALKVHEDRARRIEDRRRDEKAQRQREEARQIREERESERKMRYKKWQDLHIVRMELETDVRRHEHLAMRPRTYEEEEQDANGEPFERVPIFTSRSGRPEHRAGTYEGRPWSDEQLQFLLDGLEKYSGPYVFEKIFKHDCRPGGPLRDFNVEEITWQAAYMRSLIKAMDASEEKPTVEWVENIPVLP